MNNKKNRRHSLFLKLRKIRTSIRGSIEGIAGSENIQLELIDDVDPLLMDE